MYTRRDLLSLSALAFAAGCAMRLPAAVLRSDKDHPLYGVQLYTVRKEARANLADLLRTLRRIGFTEVELHPLSFTMPAPTLRQMVADAGLNAPSTHMSANDLDTRLDYAKQLGVSYVVSGVPSPSASLEDYRTIADRFNKWGAAARDQDMEFAHFFHGNVFLPQEGSSGFDQLIRHTNPELVKLEVDIYWLVQAGQDPAAFLRVHRDRVRLLHIKDRIADVPANYADDATAEHFTEVGKGTIPWRALLEQARRQGIRYVFIDQDKTAMPALESLEQSLTYLQTLKL
jgi:sugar phosphate isomerase/epimerase